MYCICVSVSHSGFTAYRSYFGLPMIMRWASQQRDSEVLVTSWRLYHSENHRNWRIHVWHTYGSYGWCQCHTRNETEESHILQVCYISLSPNFPDVFELHGGRPKIAKKSGEATVSCAWITQGMAPGMGVAGIIINHTLLVGGLVAIFYFPIYWE